MQKGSITFGGVADSLYICSMNLILRYLFILIVLLPVSVSAQITAKDGVLVINEIMAANIDRFVDPSNNYGGWIELYNTGNTEMALSQCYISDDSTNLKKYRLPSTMPKVKGGGYCNIWFDHHQSQGEYGGKSYNQVPFKLDVEGGYILLSDKLGNLLCSATYPPSVPRCSYARKQNAGVEWGYSSNPTPGSSNLLCVFAVGRFDAPQIDVKSGVYESGTKVTFHVTVPARAQLVYTTDGSTPTSTNGTKTDQTEFSVDKTTVMRFACIGNYMLPSPVVTRSFVFKNHDYYLPVLSVSTAPANLFDNTLGIYCTGTNGVSGKGQDSPKNWNMSWERPVNMVYMVPETNSDGQTSFTEVLNQEVDMEICGGWSRGYGGGTVDGKYWEMKSSFRLKTDKKYEGVNEIDYPVFPLKPHNKYRVWQVRNGGNDTQSRIIDPFIHQLALRSDFYIDAQDCQPCHVFFNNDYVGMFNIRESNNRHYGYSNYGIDTDDMDQFEISGGYVQKVGDNAAWTKLVNAAKTLSTQKTSTAYEEVCELLDVDEFINYMAFETYVGSNDWLTNNNNCKGFRGRSDDGKFHIILFDIDAAYNNSNMLSSIMNNNYNGEVDDIFRYLMAYEPARRRFIDAYCLVDGSLMEPSRVDAIVNEMIAERNKAIGFEGNQCQTNMASRIKNGYNGARLTYLGNVLNAKPQYHVSLASNIAEARLFVNQQPVPTHRFSGYLCNYNNGGIKLTAKAPVGYTFDGWYQYGSSDGIEKTTLIQLGDEWEYYDKGSLDGANWQLPDYDASAKGWLTGAAPLGYANSGTNFDNLLKTRLNYGSNSNSKRPTYYFRKKFYLEDVPASDDKIVLNYQVDDGFRFYVNGKDINGFRCGKGVKYDYVTNEWAGDTPDEGTYEIEAADLLPGWNYLAVEVHNTSLSSSDIYWDAELLKLHTLVDEGNLVSSDETFDMASLSNPDNLFLTARFTAVHDERTRLEMGASPIRINEVSAGNDIHINDLGKRKDWVELYNSSDSDIDVKGMYLSDNKSKAQKWQIDRETIVPAHGTAIVWCDQQEGLTQLHAPFKLDNADGAIVSIQAEDGSWADRLEYLEQPRWTTYGRFPDGGSIHTILSQPTINKSNRLSGFDFITAPANCFDDDVYVYLELKKGWNWMSHNLGDEVHRSRFTGVSQYMMSSTQSYVFDAETGEWKGDLNTLSPGMGYKMQCADDAEVMLRGNLFASSLTPVQLRAGFNWIGFPLFNATTLDAAFSKFKPSDGDVIISLDAFAVYAGGEWKGTLTQLQPAQMYVYKSLNDCSLYWNALSTPRQQSKRYRAASTQVDEAWQYDIHAYPNVSVMCGSVLADDADLDGRCYVGAFVQDECRGVGILQDNLFYINIHGLSGEKLEFRLLDASGDVFTARYTPFFRSNYVLGSPDNPMILDFNNPEPDEIVSTSFSNSRKVATQYYTLSGQRTLKPTGICVEKTFYEDGTVVVKRKKF